MWKFLKNSIKKNLTELFCSLFPSEVGSCWVLLPFAQVMLGFSFVGIIKAAGSMTLTIRLLLFCGTTKLCRKSIPPRLPLAFLGWWNAPSSTLWKQHTQRKKLILILTSFEMCSDINNILAYYLPKLQNFFQLLNVDCVRFWTISCYIMNVIF